MKQLIITNGKSINLDAGIPAMKGMLITEGIISAIADDFILKELADDADVLTLSPRTLVPAFIDSCVDLSGFIKAICTEEGCSKKEALGKISLWYKKEGFSTIGVRDLTLSDWEFLCEADKEGFLQTDIACYFTTEAAGKLLPENLPVHTPYQGHLRPAGLSLSLDGPLLEKKAWLSAPYEGTDTCGEGLMSDEALLSTLAKALSSHWQVRAKAYGDAAIRQLVSCYFAALKAVGGTRKKEDGSEVPVITEDTRLLIDGAVVMTEELAEQAAALGIVPNFYLDETLANGEQYRALLGEERAKKLCPTRTYSKLHCGYTVTSHAPSTMPQPFISLKNGLIRRTPAGEKLGATQTLAIDELYKTMTLYAAYALFEDSSKGSISPRKRADLLVLNRNPFETAKEDTDKITIEEIVSGGNRITTA